MTLEEVVTQLGGMTPEEIAEHFRERGIKGAPTQATQCPVARYVRNEVTSAILASVWDRITITVLENDEDRNWPIHEQVNTPESVRQFVTRFDSGEFEYLATEERI